MTRKPIGAEVVAYGISEQKEAEESYEDSRVYHR
jgi:hypothetical protein